MKSNRKRPISLEIIIPVYNEEAVLNDLFDELQTVFTDDDLKENNIKNIQYLFIDDGSSDKSVKMISNFIKKGATAKLFRLSRNFGHQNAVSSGLDKSTANVAAVIDADLQDPPEVILQMIEKWREGFDVVYGERRNRKENIFKRSAYWLFYRMLNMLSEIKIPLDSGDFSIMDRKVVDAICKLPEVLKYPRVLRAWAGFSQIGFPYERDYRKAGQTKYSFANYYKLATDGISSASTKPLRMSQVIVIWYSIAWVCLITISLLKYFSYTSIDPSMRTVSDELSLWFLFTFVLISFSAFVQSLALYVISAYVGRGYLETKDRPPYIIMDVIE